MSGSNEPKISGKHAGPAPGEEVVISGIAGRFPESDNMDMLKENLMNGKDLITDDDRRWKLDHPEIPQRIGKVSNIQKFDALFFGVHFKQAHTLDPMCRMLLEHAYEAIVDAGVNPRQLRGTKTGVFIGACFSESEKTWFYEKLQVNGFGITGCSRAMLANRISYWLGVTGPSYTVDSACSSSLFALEHAYRSIRSGQCDAAIVGGSNLCLHPYVSLQFSRLGVLSPDGRCKSFDEDANGYTRSETIAVIFLQKAKDAKRIYATVVHGKINCDGYKEQGITFPSSKLQGILYEEFYKECGLPTTCLTYMEAHGTGTMVGDPEEINAIDQVFSPGRTTPLKVGSVKSNLGHSEPASGLCSVAKAIVAMETGIIPKNINFKRPRKSIKALMEGRIKVVAEPTPLDGEYVGVNSFGFGGANAHILFKSNPKTKVNKGMPKDDLPRLVTVSGRTEEAVEVFLNAIDSQPVDVEYVRLLHSLHMEEIPGHLYRGYTIAGRTTPEDRIREIEHYPGTKRPIWFVFSGMGSQWPGMGQSLLRFPVFAEAIAKCDVVLKPRNIDIYEILTNKKDKSIFDNILHSFVGIAAIQIGLVDLLNSVGIVPDYIIGHSVGELGCAYADGCFTAEQMILAAYSRGIASTETKVIYGSMAAVGLGYEDLKGLCPPDIEVACHNGPESSTISGPADSVRAFVEKLQANKIFAKEVLCSNIPYHSRYIAAAGPKLLAYLKKVIPEPKPRSQKWLSTSVPRKEWSSTAARFSSAEYHTNNLLKPVLFEETAVLIPNNAVTIEIAPHGLLQAILKRSLHPTVTNIALTRRNHRDNVEVFLQGLGKLYNIGLQPDIAKLYPPVEFPVSRGTPMISPHIRWEHSDDWYVTSYKMQEKIVSGERTVEIILTDEDFEYISGHVIDGRNLFPATGYLSLAWETVGMMLGKLYTEVSVVFEDVRFNRATTMPKEGKVNLIVMVQKGSGRFEVIEGGTAVVTGTIRAVSNLSKEKMPADILATEVDNEDEVMTTKDIYKEFKLRGYQYNGYFRSLHSATVTGSKGHIEWRNNWVTFMDNMLQLQILSMDTRGLFVPTGIRKLIIDASGHQRYLRSLPAEKKYVPVRVYKNFNVSVAGGVEIHGLKAHAIARKKSMNESVLEEYKFVAHCDKKEISLREILTLSTHIALENQQLIKVKTVELVEDTEDVPVEKLASPLLLEILGNLPLIQANVNLFTSSQKFDDDKLPQNVILSEPTKLQTDGTALLAIGSDLLTKDKRENLNQLISCLREGAFLLSREKSNEAPDFSILKKFEIDIILEKRTSEESWILLKKKHRIPKTTLFVNVNNNEFSWIDKVKDIIAKDEVEISDQTRVILVGEGFESGLLGFVNCLRKEPGGEIFRAVLIQDPEAPTFSLEHPLYAKQLELDLAINVLRSGHVWGSYRHLLLPPVESRLVHHTFATQLTRGDLNSVCWFEGPIPVNYKGNDLVHIYYSSLNFKDVMVATGKLAAEVVVVTRKDLEHLLGFEYSGITATGRRMMGVSDRSLSNHLITDYSLSWPVPDNWSLEDAATVPCVYTTCIYAFYVRGNLQKGHKILIHSGTGGVGQAAINLALAEGCEIFTTVGTPEKRKFIREHFPSIDDDHIGNSRDTSFEQLILKKTNGRGVDIVLNSLAEEKLQASLRCLAQGGQFLEIGKVDLAANNSLGMEIFLRNISFHSVMLDALLVTNDERKSTLRSKFQIYMDKGAIKPLIRKVFGKDQIQEAFRYMGAGKHIGKVMIKIREENESPNAPILAQPRYVCSSTKSYVILGGLGGFGLELTDWMIMRDAKNIVLTSRHGIKNGYQRMRIKLWESYGVNIVVIAGRDASKRKDCEFILKTARDLGPVDGIFNLAVCLKDGLCKNQTPENFDESFRAKAWATKCLDEVSRELCPELRHFVVFSSVSCGRGNAGQTNYGMANSIMERICERRVEEGLPGLSIQWGAIGEVGLVADMQENDKELVIGGTLQQKITSCLHELNGFLVQNKPIVASMVVAEKRAGSFGSNNIVDTVLNIMSVKDLKTVSQQTPLAELGMDSMMAVEIKQTLEREFEIYLTAQDIRSLNFAKLIEMNNARLEKNNNTKKPTEVITGAKLLIRLFGEELRTDITLALDTKPEIGRSEIFLVPGIEGYGSIFKTLAPKIKSPATCLQLASNHEYKTLPDMANMLLPHLLAKLKDRRDFTLVGYSFGSLVAIELARRLESEGLNGRLILIDGSPEYMIAMIKQHMYSSLDEEMENSTLLGIMDTFAPVNSAQLAIELNKCTTWDERVSAFLAIMPSEHKKLIPEETHRNAIVAFYTRIRAAMTYAPEPLPYVRTPITLIKPSSISIEDISEDYGLRSITRDKVEIHVVEGNHVTMLDNAKVAMAVNGEPVEDAEEFKQSLMSNHGTLMALLTETNEHKRP